MGESERGLSGEKISSDVLDTKAGGENTRPAFEALDFVLVADFMEVVSDLSIPPPPVSIFDNDVLGLSVFPLPGIFDRIAPRSDRDDSFVSDLLNDGYDCRPSPTVRSAKLVRSRFAPLEASFSFEGCCPMPVLCLKSRRFPF